MKKKILSIVTVTLMFSGVLTGCAVKEGNTIATDGSSSMEKVIGALGEAFIEKNDMGRFTYNPTGSSTGITAVAEGRCDIGLSTRVLKDEEMSSDLTETIIAYDGIAVIVNPENNISDLDIETIAKIYTGEITNWKELGGRDGEIVLIGREANSGTRDGFESVIGTENACKYRQELTTTGDVITTVANNPNAIGYASIASVKEIVKVISVNGVLPTDENIKKGTYVIKRPFVLITKTDNQLSPTEQAFYEFCFSEEAKSIIELAGVVPVY